MASAGSTSNAFNFYLSEAFSNGTGPGFAKRDIVVPACMWPAILSNRSLV